MTETTVPKITYEQFSAMLTDPTVTEAEIRPYIVADPDPLDAFNVQIRPNLDRVDMTDSEVEAENAMASANSLARLRRQLVFARSHKSPVLVSEGDSWFQFPILVDDVIDHLGQTYRINCMAAAGDTASNMIVRRPEYLSALRKLRKTVAAFLLSAAGNDVIGNDEQGRSVLTTLVRPFNNTLDPRSHIVEPELDRTLQFLRSAYTQVITNVRAIPELTDLPIVIHGYDYVFPGRANDPRHPIYTSHDHWLGRPLTALGIVDAGLQRGIVKLLIDELYEMLTDLAATHQGVFVVDLRGTLPDISDWNDEIHPTSAGFAKVAAKFDSTIRAALAP